MKLRLIDINRTTTKQRLILAICLLLILIFFLNLLVNLNKEKTIDYPKTNIDSLLATALETNDRKTYWTLNNIIVDYILSYKNSENSDNVSYVDYYNCLFGEYADFLGKNGYKKKAEEFLNKFVIASSQEGSMKTNDLIDTCYQDMNNGYYICKLNTAKEGEYAYIGIILNENQLTYSIFYLE